MRITFISHAKQRCEQRNISMRWLEARLRTVPLSEGRHEHVLDGTNVFVAYHDDGDIRYVFTVYLSTDPVDKPPLNVDKHVKAARDMVAKAVQKSRARGKGRKKLKRK